MEIVIFDVLTRTVTSVTNLAACGAAIWYVTSQRRPGYPWRTWYWFAASVAAMQGAAFAAAAMFHGVTDERWWRVWARVNGLTVALAVILAVWFRISATRWSTTTNA